MRTAYLSALLAASVSLSAGEAPKTADREPVVQIAILLDTSNSMDGLIAQAKSQLWKIVNEFVNAKQKGKRPEMQIALFEYGNDNIPSSVGHIRQVQPLTTDLDKISEELFKLKTRGGQEYCGQVIKVAVETLAWSSSPEDFKAIFIAGNEPFTQGRIDFAKACKAAIEKGIIVNTIHCGSEQEGVNGRWRDGALLAEGKYMFIDQNAAVVHYQAPQDQEIARLGLELNKTYIGYGKAAAENQLRQFQQDANAAHYSLSGSAVQRALTKSSANYRNGNWDLVDAIKNGELKPESVPLKDLPEEMQKMNEGERKAYIEKKIAERTQLQTRIQQLNGEREKYVAEQMKKNSGGTTLDSVMSSAIREQAGKKGVRF